MKVLIQEALVVDPQSAHNGKKLDILVRDGQIALIDIAIDVEADAVISHPDLQVSPGWVDIFSNFADPGYEFKETLESGAAAAAAGGYTDVFVIPNTKPALDSKSQVQYVVHKAAGLPVNIYPIGAISRNTDGKDLAEMYDMHASGAVAFSDGLHPVQSAGLLVKALQYVKAISGVVIQIPDDISLGPHGLMDEGIVSTRLGLPGKPMMAEELLVARDIKLARYAESRIHFTGITSPKSLEYIRRAKESGLDVTCSITPYHLFFTDEDLVSYDTNLKVYPPLRSGKAVEALVAAIMDGTVDCIATHHLPHEYDSKVVEFEYAKPGMIGLETAYAVLRTRLPQVTGERWVELLSINPRRIFGLPQSRIETGELASLSLFAPSITEVVDEKKIRSLSRNSPFIGISLTGKSLGIVNGERFHFNK